MCTDRGVSWVAMTIVVDLSATTRSSRSMLSAPVAESRLPVGSSARISAGEPLNARATRYPLLLAVGELGGYSGFASRQLDCGQ